MDPLVDAFEDSHRPLGQHTLPGYGDTAWGLIIDVLDLAIPKGKYMAGVLRDTVDVLTSLEKQFTALEQLTDVADALHEFESSPSPSSLRRLDRSIPEAIEVLDLTRTNLERVLNVVEKPTQILVSLRDKVDAMESEIPPILRVPLESSGIVDNIRRAAEDSLALYQTLTRLSVQVQDDMYTLQEIHEIVRSTEEETQSSSSAQDLVLVTFIFVLAALGIGTFIGYLVGP